MTGRRSCDMQMISFQRIQTKQALIVTPTMCLNEEIVQPVSHTHKLYLNVITWLKVVMSRVRSRNAYQHVSDFGKDRNEAYRNCGLSYHSIAARVGRDSMTVSRIWNRWVQDGNT
ncbi:HTH_Tnp_Tc3_2 domain-containing protein [Trichonephila clavipes]|nr:HTH_Tnp_Tc3_2 domain-containing protein [Trichonephila clavipes]